MVITGVGVVLAAAISIVLVKGVVSDDDSLKQQADMKKTVSVHPTSHADSALKAPIESITDQVETSPPEQLSSVIPGNKISLQDTSFQNENPGQIYYRNKVLVLMYHEVTPGQVNNQSLNIDKFKMQLSLMKDNGFQWITMNQYVEFVLHRRPIPPNAVLMTFDDGYESFYEDVYPLLLKYNVPATNFLIVNTVGNPKHVGIPKLTWEQVREMHQSGVDFYSHSFDSHFYAPLDSAGKISKAVLRGRVYIKQLGRKETKEEYIERVRSDLDQANAVLHEKIGNTMNVIAFPYGVFSPALLRVCKELDMPVSFTVLPGINSAGGLTGYRINAGGANNDPDALIAFMKTGAVVPGNLRNSAKPGLRQGAVPQLPLPATKSGKPRISAD
jgi:biofilm PGA synthesis lipoprotein PgaB